MPKTKAGIGSLVLIGVGLWAWSKAKAAPAIPPEPAPAPSPIPEPPPVDGMPPPYEPPPELPPGFPEPPGQPLPGEPLPEVPVEWQWLVDSLMENLGYTYEQAVIEAARIYAERERLAAEITLIFHSIPSTMMINQAYVASAVIALPYSSRTHYQLSFALSGYGESLDAVEYQIHSGEYTVVTPDAILSPGKSLYTLPAKQFTLQPSDWRVPLDRFPAGQYNLEVYLTKRTIYGYDTMGYPQIRIWQGEKVGVVNVV